MQKRPSVMAGGPLARPGHAPARTTPIEDLPRQAATAAPMSTPPAGPPAAAGLPAAAEPTPSTPAAASGIKAATIGTTVYLLPAEHKRVRRLALDMDVPSVHELLLRGLDRLFAEQGAAPVRRYSPPRPSKG